MTRFSEIAHDIESQYDPNHDLDTSKTAPPVRYIEYRLLELCEDLDARLTALEAKPQEPDYWRKWAAAEVEIKTAELDAARAERDNLAAERKRLEATARELTRQRDNLTAQVDDLRNVLEEVEWCDDACPWCHGRPRGLGHSVACHRQAALR